MILELLQVFAENIAPIFLIAGVGFFVARRFTLNSRQLGQLLFNILSPALVLHSLTSNTISPQEFGLLALVMTTFIGILVVTAFLLARWQSGNRVEQAGLVLTAMWPNNGNLGLPVVNFAFGPEALARAVIFYVTVSILNYTFGLYVASSGRSTPFQALKGILKVPMIYAVIAGLFINISHVLLPIPLERAVTLLSQATIPVMLIMLGVQLAQSERLKHPHLVFTSVSLRLLVSPILAMVLASVFALNSLAATAFILQASMPVAVATIIFASEYHLEREQVLGSVLVSTLCSPITLTILILILQQRSV